MKVKHLIKKVLMGGLGLGILSGLMACPRPGGVGGTATNFALILSPSNNQMLVFNLLTHRVENKKAVGNLPQDIAVSSDSQRVLVTNFNDGTISAFERQTGERFIDRGVLSVGPQPAGVAFNSNGTEAFVSTAGNGSVVMLSTGNTSQQPSIIATVRIQTSATTPKTPAPGRLIVSPDNANIYVVDTANNAVVQFTRQGNTLTQGNAWLAPANVPFELRDITIDNRGRLYVINAANDEIIIFNAQNIQNEVAHVSLRDVPGRVINPTNLALNNSQTKLYITESSANAVGVLGLNNNLQGNISFENQSVGRNIPLNTGNTSSRSVTNPIGVDTTSNDALVYVSNGGNFNISLLDGNSDTPMRNFATSQSLGNSVPLGKIVIFSISNATIPSLGIQSEDSTPTLPDLTHAFRF